METRYLILARYAEFAPDGKLTLVGGDNNQFVGEIYPHVIPVILGAARTVFDYADGQKDHEFRTILVSEDTDEIIAEGARGTIPKFIVTDHAAKLGTGFIINFTNVIIPNKGRYIVKLLLDGEVSATTPLKVAPIADYKNVTISPVRSASEGSEDGPDDRGASQ